MKTTTRREEAKENAVESLQELALRLENGFEKRQKSLIQNVFTAVIAAVIINIVGTFTTIYTTVNKNTEKIARLELKQDKESDDQRRLNEFVATLQVQYMYTNGQIEHNTKAIDKVNTKVEEFINDYYRSATRGGSTSKNSSSSKL